MTERVVFVNGEFLTAGEARLSVFDLGLLYAESVFETTCCWRGRLFKLEHYLDRLFRSLAYARIEPPYPRAELRELLLETVRRNALADAYVKCVITRGTAERPTIAAPDARPSCIVFALPYLTVVGDEAARRGARLRTATLRRTPPSALDPRVKSTNFLNIALGVIEARQAGADSSLILDVDGHVAEGAGFNVFAVSAGRLTTPAAGVLEGITRATVLEIAGELGIEAREETLELYDLYTADEVFLSSTAGGIMPAVEIDGRRIGDGKLGPVFARVRKAYAEMLESDRYGTPVYAAAESGARAVWARRGEEEP